VGVRFVDSVGARPDGALLGGKAARLAELGAAGLPVPPWFCVTTRVYADVVAGLRGRIESLLAPLAIDDRAAVRAASQELRELVRGAALPAADRAELVARFDAVFAAGARVAVRSSVVGEDSAVDSFAGQMDTYLHVTRDQVIERVLDCFASAYSERALAYRLLRRRDGASVEVSAAVLVQLMVESRASGVLFTANPTTGQAGEVVVSAGLGLGEGIVAGLVETDTIFMDLASGAVQHETVVEKRSRIVFDAAAGAGTKLESIGAAEGDAACLSPAQLGALCELARKVQAQAGATPQDLEWAFDARGTLYLLQARPITTLGRGRESIFDNSNIVESYPGLVLPLTFSFARAGYEHIFRENARLLGAPEYLVEQHFHVYQSLVGLLDGRAYYNILSWYQLFQLVPGFEWALPAWEKALGLTRLVRPRRYSRRERMALLPARVRVYSAITTLFFRLERRIADFFATLAALQADVARRPLAELTSHDLVELADRLMRRVMPAYAISPLNDSFGQQLHAALGAMIEKWQLGDPVALRNDLLCGESGMESVAPVRSILAITDAIRARPALRQVLDGGASPAEVWRALQADPGVRPLLDEHLALYGDRTVHELKLETVTLEEDPTFLVIMLRNYLAGGQANVEMEQREHEIRARGEAQARKALGFRPGRRWLFGYALRRLRAAVRDRENLRFARSRVVGMARRIYRELGRRLAEDKLLAEPRDVFWLGMDEVAAAVRGQSLTRDLAGLVALRKREYEGFAKARPGARITTYGIVGAPSNSFAGDVATGGEGTAGAGVLRGTGCGSGRVEARAKVILDPQSNLDVRGEILIAPSTDPGWVFLMVAAAGLVAEKGSLLSHTAIIGRELGIPTVVGVKDATRLVADGARVRLDGHAGTLEILGADDAAADQSARP
jgi:pyruvate,water dikinase